MALMKRIVETRGEDCTFIGSASRAAGPGVGACSSAGSDPAGYASPGYGQKQVLNIWWEDSGNEKQFPVAIVSADATPRTYGAIVGPPGRNPM